MSTDHSLEQRDRHLRDAAAQSGLGAAALADELARYGAKAWLRDRQSDDCPPRLQGRLQWHLWHALRAYPQIPGESQVAAILGDIETAPLDADARRRNDAERQRLRRQRRKDGVTIVSVEVSFDVLDALADAGLVAWNEADRAVLGEAATSALWAWAGVTRDA
jgi:hypothetical protein